jgi:hypothetical protein
LKRLLLILGLFALPAWGQSTTVSGNITDSGSQAWANGSFSFQFYPNPQYPSGPYTWTGGAFNPTQNINGTLDSGGNYSVSIPSNTAITPINSQWTVQFCPQANPSQCKTFGPITVAGATQTYSPTPPSLQVLPGLFAVAYSDAEIYGFSEGSFYWNLTTAFLRVYHAGAWANISGGGGGGGTVTSFSSGNLSPLFTTNVATPTTTPALSFTLSTQSANQIFAGPTTGSAAAPTFRSLVTADLPAGVGTVTAFTSGNLSPLFTTSVATGTTTPALSFAASNAAAGTLFGNSTGSSAAPTFATIGSYLIAGSNITLTPSGGTLVIASGGGGGGGGVTSVAQTVPSWLTVSGSPITTAGTLAISATTGQTSHQVIGTCGSATSFAPCSLVASDIPTLNQNTTGNAATATALAATPTNCGVNVAATGVAANGNAVGCFTPSGAGTVTNPNGNFTLGENLVAANATTGAASSPAFLDCSVFAGADDSIKIHACLVALHTLNALGGVADARGMTGGVWSTNPFAASSLPNSGKLLLPPGNITISNVPVVPPSYWAMEGVSTQSTLSSYGTTLVAGASYPTTYSTGTVTIGTAGANDVITGSGTGWVSNVGGSGNIGPGCAFVSPAGGAVANVTYGIISQTASITSTSITLAYGINVGSGAPGGSTYDIYCPVFVWGDGNNGANSAGIVLQDAEIDGGNRTDVAAIEWFAQQMGYAENLNIRHFCGIGLDIEGPNVQNSGPWKNIVSAPGSCGTTNSISIVVRQATSFYGLNGIGVGGGSDPSTPAVGLDVQGTGNFINNVDSEGATVGVSIGANTTCVPACPYAPLPSAENNVTNVRGIGTTAVHLSNFKAANIDSIIQGVNGVAGWTNILVDDTQSCTIPASSESRLGQYVINHAGHISSSTSAVSGCTSINGGPGTGSQYALAYWSTTAALGSVMGYTGQIPVLQNAAAPVASSPGLPGAIVSASTYTIQCDSATTTIDRLTTKIFTNSGGTTVTVPDGGTTGCGSNFTFAIVNASTGTVTVNRTTSSTFLIVDGSTVTNSATTFNLTAGQYATLNSYDGANYLVRAVK